MGINEWGQGTRFLQPASRNPELDAVQAAANSGNPTWYNTLPNAASQSITVAIPAGVGRDIPVRVNQYTTGGSWWAGRRSLDMATSRFSYDPPAISFVTLRRLDLANPQDEYAARRSLGDDVIDGTSGSNGTATPSSAVIDQLRIVEVFGSNFGPSAGSSYVQVTEIGGSGLVVNSNTRAELPTFVDVARNMTTGSEFWRHDRIELITSVTQGQVVIVTRPTNDAPAANW